MKYIAVLLAVVAVVSALQQDRQKLSQEQLTKIKKISESCAAEYNVDAGLLSSVADGTVARDETSSKFLFCIAQKADLVDEIGHMKVDRLAGLIGNHPRLDEFRAALTKCNDVTKEDPVATVVQMNICYGTTSPVLLDV